MEKRDGQPSIAASSPRRRWDGPTGVDPAGPEPGLAVLRASKLAGLYTEETVLSYKQHTLEDNWDAIVIGSGLGGLSVAALLAKYAGKKVLVLERHYTAGFSSCAIITKEGWVIRLY